MANEQVRYDIKVEIDAAIKSLKNIAETSDTGAEAVKRLSMFLAKMSKETRIPLEQLRKTMVDLNKEFAKQTGAGLFSGFKGGDSGIFNAVKGYNNAAVASGRFATTQQGVVTSVNKATKAMEEADRKARGFGHGIDVIRTALGTLLAVGIFQFLNLIQSAFTTATENAKQLEESLYRLGNVERILSSEGIEVSMKGLEEGIQRIKDLFPIFSREDIAGLVGQVAISTKELGLTEQQVIDLSQAIVVLNMRSIENESIHQTGQKVISSLLTSNAKGVAALGLSFSQNAMEAKGMELGILEAGDALSDLNDQEKGQIKLAIALENTGQEVDSINDFLETNTAKIAENKASWNDFMTFIGQQINNLIPDISKFVEQLQKASELNAISGLFLDATNNKQEGIGQRLQDTSIWFKLGTGIKFTADEYERLKTILSTYSDEELLKIFPNPAAIKDRFVREIVEGLVEIKDTATDTTKALEDLTKFEGAEEFAQKLQDIADDFANAVDDLNTKRDQKLADLDLEYLRKAEDAQKDYARKVEDINRDAERDIARIKENHREQDQRDEERYQLQLWELRMRFLMDLEDALHARDARQVIRLQKQYALDKESLRRRHELEGKERESSQRNELEDIERRRQERLADARIEYEQKLADQRVAKERELADLNVWYEREYADLKLNMERKIQALIDAGIREKEITEHNAAEVYKILQKYFGPGGLTDQLYQYMLQQFSQPIPISAPLPPGMPASYWDLAAQSAQGVPTSTYGFAKGGTLIATRPTRALFGEAGPELVQFTPLNKIGGMNNSAGGSLDALGMNGNIAVDLFLSPDLEARVIENSMNGVAEAIVKINRTKV